MTKTALAPIHLTIPEYMRWSGDSRSTTYAKIAVGRLEAVKDGRRTKITYASAEADQGQLPKAQFKSASSKTVVCSDNRHDSLKG